jgi:hypothetical protein
MRRWHRAGGAWEVTVSTLTERLPMLQISNVALPGLLSRARGNVISGFRVERGRFGGDGLRQWRVVKVAP